MPIFRKAVPSDIDAVAAIYDAIHTEEEAGRTVIGWVREIYPVRETAERALKDDELYVAEEDGAVIAAARINRKQEPAYHDVPWLYAAPDEHVLVLHTLVVDPACARHGIGRAFVAFYEETARTMGCRVLRLDTNARNIRARHMYKTLGYRESGIIPTVFNGISGVDLVCLEKRTEGEQL